MKVYSYRAFENTTRNKSFSSKKDLFPSNNGGFKNKSFLDLNLFGSQNFAFQLISICLLTVGLLLGFQTLTQTTDISALAFFSNQSDVRALNNFGKNLKPSDSLDLKEIVAEIPNTQEEATTNIQPNTAVSDPQTITYTVKAGDNLYSIALQYDVDFTDIASDNNLSRPYNLQIGQQLYINF